MKYNPVAKAIAKEEGLYLAYLEINGRHIGMETISISGAVSKEILTVLNRAYSAWVDEAIRKQKDK